jgi:hypothetical protein
MNRLLLLFFAALPYCLSAQVINHNGEKFLAFTMQFPTDTTSLTGVDWSREHLEATFTLQGKNPLTYQVKPINDTLMELWQLQEHINYFGWALHRWDANTIISELKITDFDHDGDEDLQCWVTTNVNGNQWTQLFLNDQKQQKLVRLVNTTAPRGDGIWDAPTYDPETGLIHTELYSGAYGVQNEATYQLNGTTAQPLTMEEEDMGNSDYIVYTTYKGENGTWKKVTETREDITYEEGGEANGFVGLEQDGYIMFAADTLYNDNYTDFTLNGQQPLAYRIKLVDAYTALLSHYVNGSYVVQDTLECNVDEWNWMEGWPLVSPFQVIDYNHDGNEDLIYSPYLMVANVSTIIYINDPKTGKLVRLYDPAEGLSEFTNVSYDADKKILSTSVYGGLRGIHTNCTYRLEGIMVIPLTKTEFDHTDENQPLERTYTYKNGEWKLSKSQKQ